MSQQPRHTVAERRQQLVEAAVAILAEDGLGAATTRRVTQRAGVALGAFHYAFDSKHDLLRAVIEQSSTQFESVLRETWVHPNAGLERAMLTVVDAFWSVVERQPELLLAQHELVTHALRDPDLRPLASVQYDRTVEAVASVLDRVHGAPTGEERDDVARYLVATLDGLALQALVRGDADEARRRLALFASQVRAMPSASRDARRLSALA